MTTPIKITIALGTLGFIIAIFIDNKFGSITMFTASVIYSLLVIVDTYREFKLIENGFIRFQKIFINVGFSVSMLSILLIHAFELEVPAMFEIGSILFIFGIVAIPLISSHINEKNTNK